MTSFSDQTRVDGDIRYGPVRPGDVAKTLASTEKAERLLGYEPAVAAREGLERTVTWYRELGRNGRRKA